LAVANSVGSTTVTATVADTAARLTINGVATGSGIVSAAIPLAVGVDSIFVVVTAQDATKKTYAIGVTRARSSDGSLAALSVTPGTLAPTLVSGTTAYTVNYTTENTVSVKATPAQTGATMSWNGSALATGVFSTPLAVNYGSTDINLNVTAPDGITIVHYIITVVRVDTVPPNKPTVTVPAIVYVPDPKWTWFSGLGGGDAKFRFKFDNPDLTSGATAIASTSMATELSDGPHTLYVQERDTAGNWSASGTAKTIVMFGPASWYKFDEGDFTDHGFNKNNASSVGFKFVQDRRAKANGAVYFDGTKSSLIGTPTYPSADTNISLSCWIKLDSANSKGYAFWGQLLLYTYSMNGYAYAGVGVNVPSPADTTSSPRTFAYAEVIPGQWTHLVGTFDGSYVSLYINGVLSAGSNLGGIRGYPALDGASTIGSGNGGIWTGAIDDIRIYNRVLSPTERSTLLSSSP
jgi:hypothetical protein